MKDFKKLRLGVALCGSFCTFSKAVDLIKTLVGYGIDITPIMSFNAYETSTRFGKATDFIAEIEALTGHTMLHTLKDVEPLGPKNLIDALLIAPCTGNTLAKLSLAITDTPVLLAAKSLLRNGKPIIIALATNDGLGINLKNIGTLMAAQNIYFVPLGQDDFVHKPCSLVADLNKVPETLSLALEHQQLQPVLITYSV
ncbi:dipicolinate synthase subunit B [Sporanaerobium hydrogeniformans]|uniref:Dipicolinate synthase subunit B n=1 Tax=Sporanaerobium hydrogeniformans TaxID=3072179 RepID=A0AC61DBL5_9FIRM|nr:dipicolinate synthase subunit B [Sporanaerobium hydrogeniformans]PHV70639.1 dipicolinate synthase subunit B [Sporanaerobium hydrogeniformans]